MADTGTTRGCNNNCGCPNPCPGGESCRCTTGGGSDAQHAVCKCGEHCSCNPCTCEKISAGQGTGRSTSCRCGSGCTCAACASS